MKTTVYLDDADYRRLKRLAEAEGRSAAELIRVAVADYVGEQAPRGRPAWIGSVSSGDPTWVERAEELLEGFGES